MKTAVFEIFLMLILTARTVVAAELCSTERYQRYEIDAPDTSITLSGLVEGEHEFSAYTVDTNGLTSPSTDPYRVILTSNSAKLSWTRPEIRMNGSELLPEEISGYLVYDQYATEVPCSEVSPPPEETPNTTQAQAAGNAIVTAAAAAISNIQPPELQEGECLPGVMCPESDTDIEVGIGDGEVDSGGEASEVTKTEVDLLDFFPPEMDSTCFGYCFTGICIWLDCSPVGCSVRTSPRVSHRNPDAVVSVYQEIGENPWKEIRLIYGALQKEVLDQSISLWRIKPIDEAGSADQISRSKQTRPLLYREVDAFGYPYYLGLLNDELFCRTKSVPFTPIFQSSFDNFNWRVAPGEYVYAHKLLPGVEHVGTFMFDNWGKVYRRYGFIGQLNEPVANAVLAQRVGSIISENYQPHLYYPIEGAPEGVGQKFFVEPPPLVAGEEEGGVWQMLAPMKDSQCYLFGDEAQKDWAEGRESEDKASVFVLWRPYECCKDKGSYVTTIPAEVCL